MIQNKKKYRPLTLIKFEDESLNSREEELPLVSELLFDLSCYKVQHILSNKFQSMNT